jgi:urea transport system permease protein
VRDLALLMACRCCRCCPPDNALQVSAYTLTLVGKILCYAIVALALDLVWGYAGLLSLGHGLFFALGGYAMGMYLMRQAAGDGLPAFMTFLSWTELPWFWSGTSSFVWSMCLVVLAPGLLALVFGFFAFRSRIKGVYFSIMTQALTFAGMLLFFRNETGFGGNNGFTNFRTILGFGITEPGTRAVLFLATVLLLVASLYIGWRLARSKFGRVLTALRDAENRLMFCGYDPRGFKLFVWVLSAVLCGLAGALYVPQVGIINPSEMSPTNSIEAAVWVALGGRGTLIGPLLGAGVVNGMKSWFTVAFPEYWLFFLGALFIVVTLYLPKGVIGLLKKRGESMRVTASAEFMLEPAFFPVGAKQGCWHQPRLDRSRPTRPAGPRTRVHGTILTLEDISVSFDGFKALNDLNLYIGVGELRCIIGPNGAGKTTLMDVITGKTRPSHGKAWFGETLDLTQMSEVQIAQAGIGRKFQKPTVFEALSVFENLELAQKTDKSVWASLRARLSGEQKDRISEVLETIRLTTSVNRPAGLLSHGQKQFLEIGMLLMQDPQLLLLDEPVAGMTDAETEFTAELFKRLAGKHSLMVVEHDMGFVGSIADHVTVLHQGSVLAEGSLEQVQENERVIEVYLGR